MGRDARGRIARLAQRSCAVGGQAEPPPGGAIATSGLGELRFDNGYPTKVTAEKLYDELDLQRATQAYLWALPAVGFTALYDAQAKTMGVRICPHRGLLRQDLAAQRHRAAGSGGALRYSALRH